MKKFRAYLLLLPVLCLVLPLLAACNASDDGGQTDTPVPGTDEGNILTNIFEETSAPLPDEANINEEVLPYYDSEAGTITEFLLEREEVVGENNVIENVPGGWLYTLSEDGELLNRTELPLPENFYSLGGGIVLSDTVIFTGFTADREPTVWKADRSTMEITASAAVREIAGTEIEFYQNGSSFDEEGRIYWTDRRTVLVLNPDLTPAFVYNFPTTIYRMARGADGNVWVVFNAGMESCAAVIDPETGELGTYYPFTRGMASGYSPKHYLLNSTMNTGNSAYNFFYYDMDGALWGVTVTEEGKLEETQVFDLFNSGISQLNTTGGSSDGDLFPIAFLTDELFLTRKFDWDDRSSTFIFHHHAEDIDMSEQSVITIAYAYPLQVSVIEHITEFKRTRPNVSIVLEDYSQYITNDNLRGGEEKLCFDLVNGFIQPDIVITKPLPYLMSPLSDNSVVVQIHRNNLYVDLVPYLEKDDVLNFDNLFGSVLRLFDDGKGGMWGITPYFEADTMIGSAKLLGDYTAKGYWNFSEMLDFLDSLPEGTEKIYSYNRIQGGHTLLAQNYGYFIHDGTCSFDSEEFIRYLEFFKTVPKDFSEWLRSSPVAEIRSMNPMEQTAAIHAALTDGKIALMSSEVGYEGFYNLLTTPGHSAIGYASGGTSGWRLNVENSYIITTFSENPNLCFELLKSFFVLEKKVLADGFSTSMPLFSRKDHFKQAAGGTSLASLGPQELAGLYELLDNAGSPILEKTPEDVQNIVNEEMSAFLSGMGTAEDCAKKIQSRVNIWLSEHE